MISGNSVRLLAGTVVFALSACGSGGEDSKQDEQVMVDPVVATTDTDVLRANAADRIGRSLGISLDGFQGSNVVSSGSSSTSVTSTIEVITGEPAPMLIDEPGDEELISDSEAGTEANSLLLTSLGLGDGEGATTSRDGNRITIDPDEEALCRENALDQDTLDSQEIERCVT
ncbi:MAG: hypothetical protein KTR32_40050, partial [Granulosicoccus sp.]|nr:hypothetical protein [Granulosicoccus sp.]